MTMQWHSAHIHHHDPGGTDRLLLEAARPLLAVLADRLDGQVSGAYFVRHWLRGPHVRVHIRTDPATWRAVVWPLVEELVGGWLDRHPSGGHPRPEQERRAHERLAELEQESGPLTPWLPDNSIHDLPYDRRLHVLGTEEAADLLAAFHTDTTPLAFRILEERPAGAERLDALLGLMFLSAQAACPPITRGYLSYRSHVEGFIANTADPAGMRTRFERVYEANRDLLAETLRAAVDGAVDHPERLGEIPYAARWLPVVRRYTALARPLVQQGRLLLSPPADREAAVLPPDGFRNVSPFHRALLGNQQVRQELYTAEWFSVYRVVLNYQYLFFSRLGVTPTERFMLCYLVARTVEDANDLPLSNVIRLLEGDWPAGGPAEFKWTVTRPVG